MLHQSALKVLEERQISVFVMVVERGARLKVVERALRVVLTSARLMGVVSVAFGANLVPISVMVALLVTVLLGGRKASVLHTLHWWKIIVYMVDIN